MLDENISAATLSTEAAQGSAEDELWRGGGLGPLAGIRVVDFGQYIAGPLVGMMFADQGADVVRVDPPGGPRWDSPVNAALLRGRRNIELDLKDQRDQARARALIASADVLIENFRPGVAERLGIGLAACMKAAPGLIYCSMPGFGSDDKRAGLAAWEGVVMAASGAYSLPSPASPTPLVKFSPLPLGSVFGAFEAATAVAAALLARERDGVGQWVETPLFDSVFEASGATGMSAERNNVSFIDFVPAWYECADGRHVNLISLWLRHYEAFVRAAGHGEWIEEGLLDFEKFKSVPGAGAEVKARLIALFKERPAREWEALGHQHGSTVAMARSLAEWMAEPHALDSGTLVDVDDPILGRVRVPGQAVAVSTAPGNVAAPRRLPGSDTASIVPILDALSTKHPAPHMPPERTASSKAPLAGLRVLDFTRVVAGPTAGRILAQLGADVIKIDCSKTDQRAMTKLPITHEYVNRGKRSMDLDLTDPADKILVKPLFASSDVVIQNFTLGVAERLGIDETAARADNPNIVYTYLNCYGRSGPWAGARGYAELANTSTGISMRSNGGKTIESGAHSLSFDLPRWPFTDFAAGILGAFAAVLGLVERSRTGTAPSVETSLTRATAIEQIIYIFGDKLSAIEPNWVESGWSPVQRLYEAADGAVFIGATATQSAALLEALGLSRLEELASAITQRSITDLTTLLGAIDVGVHRVESLATLMMPDGVAAQRGLRVEDDTKEFGRVAMLGPIARLSRTPLVRGAFAKGFGAETDEIRQTL